MPGNDSILNGPEKSPEEDLTESWHPFIGATDSEHLLIVSDSRRGVLVYLEKAAFSASATV